MEEDFSLNRVREILGETSKFDEAMMMMNEFFLSATKSGFSERQALYMISMGIFGGPSAD